MAGEGIIQLTSGTMFDVTRPTPDQIRIEDIATSLSRLARFNGHGESFYSVAQHSVLVALLIPRLIRSLCHETPFPSAKVLELQRHALFHDAHEAYIGDIPRPLKRWCTGLVDFSAGIDNAVRQRFGLVSVEGSYAHIKAADQMALAIERRDVLVKPCQWADDPGSAMEDVVVTKCLLPADAAETFYDMCEALFGVRAHREGTPIEVVGHSNRNAFRFGPVATPGVTA